ncbi:phage tail assembly protein [Haemophilus influenzae]|uniref:phage tail assembly protein n=1 Tax=Haemophilus influenzae TaxID=727 RepID=UPI000DD4D4B8|nr:phage tail assembly protein [Haemophilus influenzae]
MSETILTLNYPIQEGQGNTLTELKIRRPKVKDLRKMKGATEVEQSINILAIVTGLVPEDIDELDMSDFQRAAKVIEDMQAGKSI